jgi:lysylphosphatidylglycerol synthetase-like protein (DUF2156 family)
MSSLKDNVALLVTVFVIAGSALLIGFMLLDVDAADETWKRYTFLLTGVEAIVFAAVGWLFGKEVHREQAAKAEEKRGEAEVQARQSTERAATEAEKGRGLARAVIAATEGDIEGDETLETAPADGGQRTSTPRSTMAALASHARSAYADL